MDALSKGLPLKSAFAIKKGPDPWRRLGGMGLATSLGLLIGFMLGHLQWGVWAFMGGFTSLYVHDQPYRIRALTLAIVGLGLTASFALGALSVVWWHMALALGFLAASATYLTAALDVPLPAGFMFVLIACISAALPLHPAGILPIRLLSVLGGAAIAWLIGMSDWLWNRNGPAFAPVSQAYRGLGDFVQHLGTSSETASGHQAARAVVLGHRAATGTNDQRLKQLAVQAEEVLRAAFGLSSQVKAPVDPEWATLLHRIAGQIRHPQNHSDPLTIPEKNPQDNTWQRWHAVMQETLDIVNGSRTDEPQTPYHPTVGERLTGSLSWNGLVAPATLRIGLAVSFSVLIAHALGISHPFWVPLTSSAVLLGVSTVIIAQRTVQRTLGTTIGLGLSGALIALRPSGLFTAVLIVILQLLMLYFMAKNYGIAVVFITALALIIINFGAHPPVMPMIWARFLDTLVGAAIGVAFALGLWGQASATRLPHQAQAVVKNTGRLLEAILKTEADTKRLRAATLNQVFAMHHIYEVGLGEIPPISDKIWPLLLSIERLAYLVIAACDESHPADPNLAQSLQPVWNILANRIEDRTTLTLHRIPAIPGYPAIEARLWDLAEDLGVLPSGARTKSS